MEKETDHTSCQNNQCYEAVKSNLPAEHISNRTSSQKEQMEKKKNVTDHTCCQNDKCYEVVKSNLLAEHKKCKVHKSSKWRKRKTKFHATDHTSCRRQNVMKQ